MRQHRAFSSTQTSNKSFEHGVLKPAARNPPRCTQSAATTDHNSSWGNGVSIAAAALVAFQCGLPLHSVAAAAAPIAPGDSPYAEAKRLVGFPYWAESVSVVCTVWSATAIEHRIDRVLFLFFIQAYGPTEDDRVRSCPTNINPNCVSTGGCVAHRAAATSQGHVLHWLRCVCVYVYVYVSAQAAPMTRTRQPGLRPSRRPLQQQTTWSGPCWRQWRGLRCCSRSHWHLALSIGHSARQGGVLCTRPCQQDRNQGTRLGMVTHYTCCHLQSVVGCPGGAIAFCRCLLLLAATPQLQLVWPGRA